MVAGPSITTDGQTRSNFEGNKPGGRKLVCIVTTSEGTRAALSALQELVPSPGVDREVDAVVGRTQTEIWRQGAKTTPGNGDLGGVVPLVRQGKKIMQPIRKKCGESVRRLVLLNGKRLAQAQARRL